MAKLLAVSPLCEKVELQTAFHPESFREGAKVRLRSKFLCFRASGNGGDGGGCLPDSLVISGEPSWLFGESQAGVVGGEFLPNVG